MSPNSIRKSAGFRVVPNEPLIFKLVFEIENLTGLF
jgi:hypothetical protein